MTPNHESEEEIQHIFTSKNKNKQTKTNLTIPINNISLYHHHHHHITNAGLSKRLTNSWPSKNSINFLLLKLDTIKGIEFTKTPELEQIKQKLVSSSRVESNLQDGDSFPAFLPASIHPNQLVKILVIKKTQQFIEKIQDIKNTSNSELKNKNKKQTEDQDKLIEYKIKIIYKNIKKVNYKKIEEKNREIILITSDDDEEEDSKEKLKQPTSGISNDDNDNNNNNDENDENDDDNDDGKPSITSLVKLEEGLADNFLFRNEPYFEINCNLKLASGNEIGENEQVEIEMTFKTINQFIKQFNLEDKNQFFKDFNNQEKEKSVQHHDHQIYHLTSPPGTSSKLPHQVNNNSNNINITTKKNGLEINNNDWDNNKIKKTVRIVIPDSTKVIQDEENERISQLKPNRKNLGQHVPRLEQEVDDDSEPHPTNTQNKEVENTQRSILKNYPIGQINYHSNQSKINENDHISTTPRTTPTPSIHYTEPKDDPINNQELQQNQHELQEEWNNISDQDSDSSFQKESYHLMQMSGIAEPDADDPYQPADESSSQSSNDEQTLDFVNFANHDMESTTPMDIPVVPEPTEVAAEPVDIPLSQERYPNSRERMESVKVDPKQQQENYTPNEIISEALRDLDSDPEDENYKPGNNKQMDLDQSDDSEDDDETSIYTTDQEDSDSDSLNSLDLNQTQNQNPPHLPPLHQTPLPSFAKSSADPENLKLKNFYLEDYSLKAKKKNEKLRKKYLDLKYKINLYQNISNNDNNNTNNKNKLGIKSLIQEKKVKKKLHKRNQTINILKGRLRKKDEKICEYQVSYQMELDRLREEISLVEEKFNIKLLKQKQISSQVEGEEREIEKRKLEKTIKLLLLIQSDQSLFISQLQDTIVSLESQVKTLESNLFPI